MAEAARDLGHEYLVLTDHSARLTVAHGLNEDRLRAQLDVLAGLNEQLAPFRILTGIEVDIFEDGSLDLDLDLLARARRRGGQRALQAAHGRPPMTGAHAGRHREPAHRHPRATAPAA